MWQVIYIAPTRQTAEELRDAMSAEGILVSLRNAGVSSTTGQSPVELLVPKGEAYDAQQVLTETLGRTRYKR